jgi:hypothetical protein
MFLCAKGVLRNPTRTTTGFWLGLDAADIHHITTFGYRHQVICAVDMALN